MKEHCFATDKKLNKKEKEQILIQLGKSNKALELKQKKWMKAMFLLHPFADDSPLTASGQQTAS